MKTALLLLLLPLAAQAGPFVLLSPKIGIWSGVPESYPGNLDKEAEKVCLQRMGTKANRIGDYSQVHNGVNYYLSGAYACERGPFELIIRCGPFGGCLGGEESELERMAKERCFKEDFKGVERNSDYRREHMRVSATYSCLDFGG